jgi:hypothetical protein
MHEYWGTVRGVMGVSDVQGIRPGSRNAQLHQKYTIYHNSRRRLTIVEYLVMKSELISGCIVLSCLALSM